MHFTLVPHSQSHLNVSKWRKQNSLVTNYKSTPVILHISHFLTMNNSYLGVQGKLCHPQISQYGWIKAQVFFSIHAFGKQSLLTNYHVYYITSLLHRTFTTLKNDVTCTMPIHVPASNESTSISKA
jgi:hypothetical protein